MTAKTSTAGERLPYKLKAQSAQGPRAAAADRRPRPRRRLGPRAVPRGPARSRGLCPRRLRRAPTHPARRLPAHKTLEDFDFSAQPSAEKPLLLHLAQLAWISEHANVCLIGPPGTGKTHLATALAIKACQAGHRIAFATAQQWVTRLEAAQDRNNLDDELRRLERYGSAGRRRSRLPAARAPSRQPALRARLAPL